MVTSKNRYILIYVVPVVVRARVYVDKEVDKIPYDNENLDFSLSPGR